MGEIISPLSHSLSHPHLTSYPTPDPHLSLSHPLRISLISSSSHPYLTSYHTVSPTPICLISPLCHHYLTLISRLISPLRISFSSLPSLTSRLPQLEPAIIWEITTLKTVANLKENVGAENNVRKARG